LVSTIPLDVMCSRIEGLEARTVERAKRLVHSSVHIIGIGLEGTPPATLRKKFWMYFPENHSPYYRVTVFSNYSPNNVPNPTKHWSLMAEVCETPMKPVHAANLIDATLDSLRIDQLIPADSRVVSTWQCRLEYGYPTPFLGRDEILRSLHNALEKMNIFSRGRFGAWKYELSNQDHSFMQGVELATGLISGA
jgi:protoporphyrinogen oxidase